MNNKEFEKMKSDPMKSWQSSDLISALDRAVKIIRAASNGVFVCPTERMGQHCETCPKMLVDKFIEEWDAE